MESHRRWRTSRIFLAALWLVMLVGSLLVVASLVNMLFPLGGGVRRLTSLDWAGYVVVSDYVNAQPVVTSISGSWTVPTISVTADDRFSAIWIGIGGQLDKTLIQIGTEQDSINGQATYSAWYELLPDFAVTVTTMNMSPGDQMKASISLVDSAPNTWSIDTKDVTTGQNFTQEFSYEASRLSAEWIVERPTVDGSLSTLTVFESVTFTEAQATLDTEVGSINSLSFSQVLMVDRQNRQLVTVSPLSSNGSSFTVAYAKSVAPSQNWASHLQEQNLASVSVAPKRLLMEAARSVKISLHRHQYIALSLLC